MYGIKNFKTMAQCRQWQDRGRRNNGDWEWKKYYEKKIIASQRISDGQSSNPKNSLEMEWMRARVICSGYTKEKRT